jgi:hypothetical protein
MLSNKNSSQATLQLATAGCRLSYVRILSRSGSTQLWSRLPSHLYAAIDRVEKMALTTPSLMSRMQMLPAEKMLASVDPGYPVHVGHVSARHPPEQRIAPVRGLHRRHAAGVLYGDALNNAFYDAPPMKEFRKKYPVAKLGGSKVLLQSLLKAYKEFGGKKSPNIGSRIPAAVPIVRQK